MEEKAKNEVIQKKSWFQGLKSEFRKIIWPNKEEVFKNTVAVVAVSVVLGLIIAALDNIIKIGIDFLLKI